MADCTYCQSFDGYAPLKLSVQKSGNNVLLYAQNQSKNIILIKRALLCIEYNGGSITLYIREGGSFDFFIGGERLEQGSTHLKFKISAASAVNARAEAEYIEITGRYVTSCTPLP